MVQVILAHPFFSFITIILLIGAIENMVVAFINRNKMECPCNCCDHDEDELPKPGHGGDD